MTPTDVVRFVIDNPELCMENMGQALDELQPFTQEHQQTLLNTLLINDGYKRGGPA